MSRQGGFTLIEILLAVAIMAVVLGMVYSSFQQTSTLSAHVEEVSAQFRSTRVAMLKITDELTSLYPFAGDEACALCPVNAQGTEGQDADEITFQTMARAVPMDAPASYHTTIHYWMDGDRLMREESPDQGDASNPPRAWPLVEGLAGFRLRYFMAKDKEWKDEWSEDAGDELPEAVEVTLLFPAKGAGADADRDGYTALTDVVRLPVGGG